MILIFSIAMDADYSSYVKSIANYVPTFLGYNNSVLAIVSHFSAVVNYVNMSKKGRW